MHTVVLLLGSNVGDRRAYLQNAWHVLSSSVGNIKLSSSLYETEAWGKTDQASFLNQVIVLNSELKPGDILARIQSIEKEAGRTRTEKWGPRTLDIDILFYDDRIIRESGLEIPHPGIPERRFILEPMHEVLPHFVHPASGQRMDELLAACGDASRVKKLAT